MGRPLEDQTDRELEEALAEGRLDERKTAIAREILSRRQQAKAEAIKRRDLATGFPLIRPAMAPSVCPSNPTF